MTRSDSGINESTSFVIGNSCKLRHLTVLVTHIPTFFFVDGYFHIIQVKLFQFTLANCSFVDIQEIKINFKLECCVNWPSSF